MNISRLLKLRRTTGGKNADKTSSLKVDIYHVFSHHLQSFNRLIFVSLLWKFHKASPHSDAYVYGHSLYRSVVCTFHGLLFWYLQKCSSPAWKNRLTQEILIDYVWLRSDVRRQFINGTRTLRYCVTSTYAWIHIFIFKWHLYVA